MDDIPNQGVYSNNGINQRNTCEMHLMTDRRMHRENEMALRDMAVCEYVACKSVCLSVGDVTE